MTDGRAWVLSYWSHEDATTSTLTPSADVVVRTNGSQTGSGRVTALLGDSAAPAGAGPWAGRSATAAASNINATMWTIVLAPA